MQRVVAIALIVSSSLAVPALAARSKGPRRSTPIALSDNGKTLVNVNPDDDTITISKVTSKAVISRGQVAVEDDPVSVAIAPNNVTAYVTNAESGTVSVINLSKRRVTKTIAVGSEPFAIAVSPNGTRAYVANSSSNDLTVIDARKNVVLTTVDLSSFGTAPRAIAITNDGDGKDNDETVFVAMFFGQIAPGKTAADEGQDDQKEGRVVAVSALTNTASVDPIRLAPIANVGFNANGKLAPAVGQVPAVASTNPATFTTPTGAYPNQLASIAIRPGKLNHAAYVVSTGASPNGPLRFNSMAQGLVSVFDTTTKTEIIAAQSDPSVRRTAPLNLNQGVNLDTGTTPRLFFTNPVAMAWRPNGADAWIVVQNSDTVVQMTVDAQGVPTIGAPVVAGAGQIRRIDLQNRTSPPAVADVPRGIAIDPKGKNAYVWNYASRTIATIDLATATVVRIATSSPSPSPGTLDADLLQGNALFNTGRGPQGRMSSEGWGGCVVCHPQGRSDNVTWMFDAGPRQTVPLDGTFAKTTGAVDQRILNWSAVRDENQDFELNTRGVFGGRGLIDDDRLFLAIGGAAGTGPTDSAAVEQFHQASGAVGAANDLMDGATLPSLLGPRRDFGVATLSDDRVYIVGGRTGTDPGTLVSGADAVLEFNPRTNVLRTRSSTGFTPRHSLGAAAVRTSGGIRIYAVGGYTSTSSSVAPQATVEEYNPATDTWRSVANLPDAVAQFGITVAGGVNTSEPNQLVHVVGGNADTESAPLPPSFSVQRFQADPTGPGVWSTFNPTGLTVRRNHGVATALRGVQSRIFVIGGQDSSGAVLDTVEEYAAQTVVPVLSAHTSLPAPRRNFGIASSLSTNQIYVIGGMDGAGADQTSIFECSIATNGATPGPVGTPSGAWVTRGNLATARRGLGVSSPPGVTNLLPAASSARSTLQDAMTSWIELRVRSARASNRLDSAAVARGRTAFSQDGLVVPAFSCATCHGGQKWTRSKVDYFGPPSPEIGLGLGNERVVGAELRQTLTQGANVLGNVGTFSLSGRSNEIRFNGADVSQTISPLGANGFNIPSLLSVAETAPYFYSGTAATLGEVLDGSKDGSGGTQHHFVSNSATRADLIAFLRSIDDTTPIFP